MSRRSNPVDDFYAYARAKVAESHVGDALGYVCGFGIPDAQPIKGEVLVNSRHHAVLLCGEIVGVVDVIPDFRGPVLCVRRSNSKKIYLIEGKHTLPYERAKAQSGGLARWLGGDPRKGTNGNRYS